MLTNPIILKEFLQAGRQARTYLFRCALVVTAALLVGPRLWESIRWGGQDWRDIARLGRSVFSTLAWLQIIALPVISFLLCSMTLREEWNNRTIEVLCASPLSRFQIVYGKFVAAVGKLVLGALALLPIMAVLLHLGRVPRHVVLGAFGLIVSTTLLTGALGLLQAARYRPGRYGWMNWFIIVVPYFLLIVLAAILSDAEDVVMAALPLPAMTAVLDDYRGGGAFGVAFSVLACSINTVVALAALVLAPRFFASSLKRHYEPKPEPAKKFSGLKKWFAGTRPAWSAEEAGLSEGPLLFLRALGASLRDYPRMTGVLGAIAVFMLGSITLSMAWTSPFYNYFRISCVVGATGLAGLGLFHSLFIAEREEARRPMRAIFDAYRFFLYPMLAVLLMVIVITYLELGWKCFVWSALPPGSCAYLAALALAPGVGALVGFAVRRSALRFVALLKRVSSHLIALLLGAGVLYMLGRSWWEAGTAAGYRWLIALCALIPAVGWMTVTLIMFGRGMKAARDYDEARANNERLRAFRFLAKKHLDVFRSLRARLIWWLLASGAVVIGGMWIVPSFLYNWLVRMESYKVLSNVAAITLGSWGGSFALGVLFGRCRLEPDPFVWQERGGPTMLLRRLPWVVYGVILLVTLAVVISDGDLYPLVDDDSYLVLLVVGLTMFGALSLFYGLWVFSREKTRRRSETLLLTGCTPWRFVWAKIRALYAALWMPLLSIPVIFLALVFTAGFRWFDWDEYLVFAFMLAQGVIFGPALCAVIGMGFGLTGRGTARAALGLISCAAWGFILFWVVILCDRFLDFGPEHFWYIYLANYALWSWVVVYVPRRLTPWHLGLSVALQAFFVGFCLGGTYEICSALDVDYDYRFVLIVLAGSLATWLVCFGWLAGVLRIFDRGMARDAVKLRK